ncbi:selenocysteine-specific elongation factor [Scopulibacillus daqui]|uniref:Selenocysteine-specific elongation factor n=1 Tax=Scopulibacillus daqui TaxID=1469162 RepID=A0ABS2PYW7_9BACL|nr:selenocysteine-specific translation elongation factor [Scopulibacillus daqui]MBM7645234.1 selenocysteine-specific elongation factor [Scopulibacillus daqui]
MNSHITIGLAGHIDHGKTALTKALTNIDTDRLKEEKERRISIENGFAYLDLDEHHRAAVIDVPGHEKFIRQMIAGVAGIDMVLIVIAADEGVMPQTKEHIDILTLLGLKEAFVILTKVNLADEEWLDLVESEVKQDLSETPFAGAPIFKVDSLSHEGIDGLRQAVIEKCNKIKPKNTNEPFRLPIDDVFTLRGFGTIARGTIFNGSIQQGEEIILLPKGKKTKARSIQVYYKDKEKAFAGQRAAINLLGVSRDEVRRGDVLVSDRKVYIPTDRIDVDIQTAKGINHPIKQRMPIVCHTGTAAVMGRIILFDRNKVNGGERFYAQLQLDKPIVAKKGDRFILRRPTPAETIGGGIVIDVQVSKHRFGEQTVRKLEQKAKGSPEDLVMQALYEHTMLDKKELIKATGLPHDICHKVIQNFIEQSIAVPLDQEHFACQIMIEAIKKQLLQSLERYHDQFPMRLGRPKAEWLKTVSAPDAIIQKAFQQLKDQHLIMADGPVIRRAEFVPHLPKAWQTRMNNAVLKLKEQGLKVEAWVDICKNQEIPDHYHIELRQFLLNTGQAVLLDDQHIADCGKFMNQVQKLKDHTNEQFTVQEAKEILGLTRKYLMPFLECCDLKGLTKREDNSRKWLIKSLDHLIIS